MPSIQDNLRVWDEADWTKYREGESWSGCWGGSEMLWYGSLLPRLHNFLPVPRILEIAPGHGRITQYLKDMCKELYLVDLSPNCIEVCQGKFTQDKHIQYFVNDGKSLEMVPDAAFDFIISFDSLVHCESDVIISYLIQVSKKLTSDGVGFFHHSNLAEYVRRGLAGLPKEIWEAESVNPGWRSAEMDAQIFRGLCEKVGLNVIAQEQFAWGGARFFDKPICVDCISTFTKRGSKWDREPIVRRHEGFQTEEAEQLRKLGEIYGKRSFPKLT